MKERGLNHIGASGLITKKGIIQINAELKNPSNESIQNWITNFISTKKASIM